MNLFFLNRSNLLAKFININRHPLNLLFVGDNDLINSFTLVPIERSKLFHPYNIAQKCLELFVDSFSFLLEP
jgi:hypothetical protein